MKKKLLITVTVLFSLFFISTVKAFDPVSHYYLCQRFLAETNNRVANLCGNYPREFCAGAISVDWSIAFYYVEGGKVYKLFHNPQYYFDVEKIATNDAEHCFAYGIMLGHYVPDSFSHNFYIPDAIRQWKMQNWYWHPLTEGRVAASIIKEHPEAYAGVQTSLDVMFEKPRLIEISQQAAGTESPVDVEEQLKAFKSVLGRPWTDVYKPSEENWLGKYIWPGLATLISTMSDYEDAKPYFEKSLDLMDRMGNDISLFNTCNNQMCPLYPHGFEALEAANREVYASTVIIGIIGLVLLIVIIMRVLKV